jgi:hypothetical protein
MAGSQRQRTQENCIDDAEDGSIRTDAKRQGEDRNNREHGAFGKQPESIANILQQIEHRLTRTQIYPTRSDGYFAEWSPREEEIAICPHKERQEPPKTTFAGSHERVSLRPSFQRRMLDGARFTHHP